jgi:hypothetical protein
MIYSETKTVGGVEVRIFTKGYCGCHPETCCHWRYKFVLPNGKTWSSDSYHDYMCIQHAR